MLVTGLNHMLKEYEYSKYIMVYEIILMMNIG